MTSNQQQRNVFGEFRVEDWYNLIQDHTYPTQFVELSVGAANAIKRYYEAVHKHSSQLSSIDALYTENDKLIVANLTNQIQAEMDAWNMPDANFFVRLSTRSPKDSAVKTQKFKDVLSRNLKVLGVNNEPKAVIRTLNECVRVKNASEAMDLIMNSQRIYYDLSRSLLMLDEELKKQMDVSMPDQKIIVRLFQVMEAPEYEFRVFVRNQRICAVTQYFKSCYLGDAFPEIQPRVMDRITELSNKVLEVIQEDQALDIAVDIRTDELKSYIIELNPFSKQTSAALFDWYNERDENILTGKLPFEFRFVERSVTISESREKLSAEIRNILQELNPIQPQPQPQEQQQEQIPPTQPKKHNPPKRFSFILGLFNSRKDLQEQ